MQTFFIKLILVIFDKVINNFKPSLLKGAKAGKLEARLRAKLKKEGWG